MLPGRTMRVITSEFEFGPDSRGAEIVVDCTASTVPLKRTDRTKSRRTTLKRVVTAASGGLTIGRRLTRAKQDCRPGQKDSRSPTR